ncbi:MAG: glycoside hydrolase family 5 protein [Oscillospiraceae bacterium]|jgi:hypothetical protein|nr:glycoside hydrolase family 5 protein [Oscillospiraceae bacterium]
MDEFSFLLKHPHVLGTLQGAASAACAVVDAVAPKAAAKPPRPLAKADFLHTKGTGVFNARGQRIFLRGVNAGGWLVHEEWMCPAKTPDFMTLRDTLATRFGAEKRDELLALYQDRYWQEQDFDRCAAMGATVIRLPFLYMNLTDDAGNFLPDAFKRLDWFVANCAKRGIYVILDLHGAYGSQNGQHHSGQINDGRQLFYNKENRAKTIRLWKAVASHFRGNPDVAGYDLLNEPLGPGYDKARTGKLQWDFFDELYRAIRAVDPDHIIIIEAVWIAIHLPHPLRYGWKNVIYQYHYYAWGLGEHTKAMVAFNAAALLCPKLIPRGVPILMGEFNCFGDAAAWRKTLQYSNQLRIHWTTWTYKTNCENWSVYAQHLPSADIAQGTEEEIRAIWEQVGTENATESALAGILKEYLA